MPGFIKPQFATLKPKAPKGDQWLHEIKFDGYRLQIHVNGGRKKVFTRNGLDWTKRFSVIAGALDIPGQAIIDGEVVVIHQGRTNFSELQAELAAGRQDRLVYYAFDLLWRDGDLRKLPEIERKHMLSDLLGENDIHLPIIYSEHLIGDGQEMFGLAAKLNFEGIVSKNAQVPYRSERNEAWLKIKPRRTGNSMQRPGLHGQSRDGMVPHGLQPDTQATLLSETRPRPRWLGAIQGQGRAGPCLQSFTARQTKPH
jgi:bifunctional non-homologous end joining protein LigD